MREIIESVLGLAAIVIIGGCIAIVVMCF